MGINKKEQRNKMSNWDKLERFIVSSSTWKSFKKSALENNVFVTLRNSPAEGYYITIDAPELLDVFVITDLHSSEPFSLNHELECMKKRWERKKLNGCHAQRLTAAELKVYDLTVEDVTNTNINILGPVLITELKTDKYGGYHIYIFGDHHVDDAVCRDHSLPTQHISEFMQNTIDANKDKVVDVFLELPFVERDSLPLTVGDYLGDIQHHFRDYLQFEKADVKNARMHYADVRYIIMPELGSIIACLFYKGPHKREQSKLLSTLLEKVEPFYRSLTFHKLIEHPKLKKQIQNIPDPDLRKHVLTFFQKRFNDKKEVLLSAWTQRAHKDVDDDWERSFLLFNSVVMDLYLAARLFRLFQNDPKSAARHSMIYTGSTHAHVYNELLMELDFDVVESDEALEEGKSYQCISTKKFKMPFFS